MTVGGLRTFEAVSLHPTQIKTHDFVGCIRNIHVNGILLRQSMAITTYNILDTYVLSFCNMPCTRHDIETSSFYITQKIMAAIYNEGKNHALKVEIGNPLVVFFFDITVGVAVTKTELTT